MKHSSIKDFRRRIGWTQWDLAERLNVDQGTVSRWERGVENPRPAAAGLLRDLILREDDRLNLQRFKSVIAHSLQPACFIDRNVRLESINAKSVEKYVRDHGLDLTTHIGFEWERHAELLSMDCSWDVFRDSGFLNGELLLARFYINTRGQGHITQYDPVFEMGELAGFGAVVVGGFDLPANQAVTLERAEVVYADEPDELVDIYVGRRAAHTRLG